MQLTLLFRRILGGFPNLPSRFESARHSVMISLPDFAGHSRRPVAFGVEAS
jgi:hypothetical protein